jgi:hypothetical protein
VGRVRDLMQWIVKLRRTGKFFCEFQAISHDDIACT